MLVLTQTVGLMFDNRPLDHVLGGIILYGVFTETVNGFHFHSFRHKALYIVIHIHVPDPSIGSSLGSGSTVLGPFLWEETFFVLSTD